MTSDRLAYSHLTIAKSAIVFAAGIVAGFVFCNSARAADCSYSNDGRMVCTGHHEMRAREHRKMGPGGFTSSPAWHGDGQSQAPIFQNHRKRRHANRKPARQVDANGNNARRPAPHWIDTSGRMVKVVTVQGYNLTVHPAFASKFLKFFALLKENNFTPPKDMVGCYSRAHKRGSNHAIGAACDIQTGWNRTVWFMYRAAEPLIRAAGLYSGCSFGDCGHIEAVRGLYNKAPNLYASLMKFQAEQSAAQAASDFETAADAVNAQAPAVVVAEAQHNASARRHRHHRIARR